MLSFGATVVLSRLLTPDEIGVYSIAVGVVALAHILRDFGVGTYIIQAPELSRTDMRAALGLAIIVAWVLAALIFIGRDLVSDFYGEARLAPVLAYLALNFVLMPFTTPVMASLSRHLKFGKILVASVGSQAASVAVGIAAAANGYGALSLAFASITQTIGLFFILSVFRGEDMPWLPSFRGIRKLLRFGGTVALTGAVRTIELESVSLILGRMMDVRAVGLFSRGNSFYTLVREHVASIFVHVMIPAFSAENRQGEDLAYALKSRLEALLGVTWPIFIVLALVAEDLILFLYGSQWGDAVPVAQLVSLVGIAFVASLPFDSMLVARGRVGVRLQIISVVAVITIASIFVGSLYSLEAVALALIAPAAIRSAALAWVAAREVSLGMKMLIGPLLRSGAVLAIVAVVVFAAQLAIDGYVDTRFARLAIIGPVAMVAWIFACYATNHRLWPEIRMSFGYARKFAGTR